MDNKRPRISVPMTPLNMAVEILCIIIIAVIIIFTITSYGKLPEIIPTHFNAAGEIDGHGSKTTVFFLLPLILFMYIGLTILGKFPQIYNYVVEITPANAQRQYTTARTFLSLIKLEIVIVFSYMEYAIITSAINNRFCMGAWFIPLTLIAIFGSIGVYIHKSTKIK